MFYVFISPWLVGFFGLTLLPMLISLYTGFTKWNGIGGTTFIGARNYHDLFTQDSLFTTAIVNTLYYAVASVVLGVAFALFLAILLNLKFTGRSFFRVVFFLPYVVTGIPVFVIWTWLFNPQYGPFNYWLGLFGIHGIAWLNSPSTAMPSLILMSLTGIGAMMVVFLAGLQNIPTELYEAARIDGASTLAQAFKITIPMLSPIILFNAIWAIIGSLQLFAQPYVMTAGGPENATLTIGLYLYQMAFTYYQFGYASAIAWVLFALTLAFSLLVFWLTRKRVYYEGGPA
jgi:multiple sugar transport system permease protein